MSILALKYLLTLLVPASFAVLSFIKTRNDDRKEIIEVKEDMDSRIVS